MHLGHARTALVAFLRARQHAGSVLMRIEDLDQARCRPEFETAILRDHEWLGLTWDEGPVRQSTRTRAYESALKKLEQEGGLFFCSCTRRELREAGAPHVEDRQPPYPGTCFESPAHPERPLAARFRSTSLPAFVDRFSGPQSSPGADAFIVRRSDGTFAYQLAVVVDDAEAGVTEVVRGDDLLHATHLQLALYRALDFDAPCFLHVPLVMSEDHTRLAKRRGSTGVHEYRDAGWTKERLLGVLAQSLGVGDGSPVSMDELVEHFELRSVPKEPVVLPSLRRFE